MYMQYTQSQVLIFLHADFLCQQSSCLESQITFDYSYGKCCNHLCISHMPNKLDNSCARICFLDSYLHLNAFDLQKNLCFRIWIFQVQSQHTTLPLQDMPFHKYVFLLGTKILPRKTVENVRMTFSEIQFWNGHVASQNFTASMYLRLRPLKRWFFSCPNVNINVPELKCSLGFLCLRGRIQYTCLGIYRPLQNIWFLKF